jgi:TOTE conflict system, Archaeo-Eukaryotic Primase domain
MVAVYWKSDDRQLFRARVDVDVGVSYHRLGEHAFYKPGTRLFAINRDGSKIVRWLGPIAIRHCRRLFPKQDTLPRGGFGNLIALPLQYAPRPEGNSVFLDDKVEHCPDQWAYLASVRPIAPSAVELIAREATRRGAARVHGGSGGIEVRVRRGRARPNRGRHLKALHVKGCAVNP